MQKLTKLMLLPVLLCLLTSGSFAQKARRTRTSSPPPVICKLSSVPKGMVVVGYKTNPACTDGKQLLVKRPANGDIICAESPLPTGFSITTEAQGDAAGTCPKKAFLITGRASSAATERRTESSDDTIARAFENRTSNLQVKGAGRVIRLLSDDMSGSRHQRFIVQLASGQTLLISHNIDLAPRINNLKTGDRVGFYGEYEWNAKGGVIHWTHHDPRGRHVTGYLIHNGKTYQ